MDIKIDTATRDFVLATQDRVLIAVFTGKTTVQAVRRASQLVSDLHDSRQEQVLVLTIVDEHASMPPLEVRVELVGFVKRGNGIVDRSTVVFEGDGFRAATVRSIVAGVSLFSRPDYPHRVCASVGAAARFLANGKSGSLAPHRVIRMVQEARRAQATQQPFLPWLKETSPTNPLEHPR